MHATWYFDFVSPFAYLQWPKLLALRERIAITPRPIVLGALLAHHGLLGPAEIAAKREFTYRTVQWRAGREAIALRFPPAHPFNPLAALRLAIACGSSWAAIEAIFLHVWAHGRAGDSAEALREVALALGIVDVEAAIANAAVKEELRANTDEALAAGVFGVPTLALDGLLFWGDDATPMIEDHLADRARFTRGDYARLATLPVAIERRR
ncbi:MAG: 2-hydroxychromene-2-carboxylate isomerase [Xanthomonadales bacterium]|nr:2-hydroxychromene-2-carboxylate isomerase [Xanthomonadales bacterium]